MAYLARRDILHNDSTFHITWKCHNNEWLLESDEAKKVYYNLLLKYKGKYGIKIYSYCFMDNHPHFTGFTPSVEALSGFMRIVNTLFSKYINKQKKRRGQVIMDRFRSPIIQDDQGLLNVMAYGDMNPIRAGMRKHPRQYRWSSYGYYAEGRKDPLITPAPSYLNLGSTQKERQEEYKNMVKALFIADGEEKEAYSRVYAIGDPDWVKEKYDNLKEIQREKRALYYERQHKVWHQNNTS